MARDDVSGSIEEGLRDRILKSFEEPVSELRIQAQAIAPLKRYVIEASLLAKEIGNTTSAESRMQSINKLAQLLRRYQANHLLAVDVLNACRLLSIFLIIGVTYEELLNEARMPPRRLPKFWPTRCDVEHLANLTMTVPSFQAMHSKSRSLEDARLQKLVKYLDADLGFPPMDDNYFFPYSYTASALCVDFVYRELTLLSQIVDDVDSLAIELLSGSRSWRQRFEFLVDVFQWRSQVFEVREIVKSLPSITEPLTDNDRCLLRVMLEIDACKHKPESSTTIIGAALYMGDEKRAFKNLLRNSFVDSKKGPGGGYWLTQDGIRWAEYLSETSGTYTPTDCTY